MTALDETSVLGLGLGELATRAGFLVVVLGIALVVQHFVVRAARKALDGSNVPSASIFVNLLRALVWSFALLGVLKPVFGVEPTAFVTALGVTSLVVSLGLQDTISNLVGGLGLMVARVVRPGDQVTVGDISGEVVDVTWRSTMVRARDGKLQLIPNSVLNKTALTRRTRWQVTVADLPLVVAPGADLDAVTEEVRGLAQTLLAGQLDPEFDVELTFGELTPFGARGVVHLHVRDDVVPAAAVDTLARALARRAWLARAEVGQA